MNLEEILLKLKEYDKQIFDGMITFREGCYDLESQSNGEYHIQKNFELNKIYFQGYVLSSPFCKNFKEKGLFDYSIEDLKKYIKENFNDLDTDYNAYLKALTLYVEACYIEDLVDKKILMEIDFLNNYSDEIKSIYLLKKEDLVKKYPEIKTKIMNKIGNQQEINAKLIIILNDVFNYFWSGYPLVY